MITSGTTDIYAVGYDKCSKCCNALVAHPSGSLTEKRTYLVKVRITPSKSDKDLETAIDYAAAAMHKVRGYCITAGVTLADFCLFLNDTNALYNYRADIIDSSGNKNMLMMSSSDGSTEFLAKVATITTARAATRRVAAVKSAIDTLAARL